MKRDYIKLGMIALIIVFIGIFIYPTMYKYDKLDQKLPVKINRITGKTHVLIGYEWREVTTEEKPRIDEVKAIKDEIYKKLENDRKSLKQEIATKVQSDINVTGMKRDIINELKDELALVKSEIEQYKKFETNPDNYFTSGDTKET